MTAIAAIDTFRTTQTMPELFGSYKPPRFEYSSTPHSILESTATFINNVIINMCSIAPLTNRVAEPHIGFNDFHHLYTLFRETESFTVMAEGNFTLPEYCSRAASAFEYYSTLVEDWDGEGAAAPSAEALRDANFFLSILGAQIASAPEPRPMLDNDGVPGIFWSNEKAYLSISFYENFSLTYHYRRSDTGTVEGKTISLEDGELINIILGYIEDI